MLATTRADQSFSSIGYLISASSLVSLTRKTRLRPLIMLVSLTPTSLADVVFTFPSRGETLSASEPIKVRWEESGLFPQFEMLESYRLFLCTGSNSTDDMITVNTLLFDGQFTGDDELNVTIDPGISPQLDGSLL